MFIKQTNNDFYLLCALLCTSLVSVYFLPAMVTRMIFLLILAAAFQTKYDYVFLVWFFIINDAPGRLFSAVMFDAARIPLYPVAAGISVSFQELFLMLYLVKFLSLRKKPRFIFKKEFSQYIAFGIVVSGYSLLLGMGLETMVKAFRDLFPWCMVLILPTFLHSRKLLIRSSLMLFPFVFLALSSQLFSYVTGNYLDHYLRGTQFRYVGVDDRTGPSRSYSAVFLTLYSIIQALYYIFNKKNEINTTYLSIIIFIGFFSIFLTATRGWIIALTIMIIGVLILTGFSNEMARWVKMTVVSVILFIIVSSQLPAIKTQVQSTMQRLHSIEALAAGDVTAGGTLKRIDIRGPRVLNKFWQSPFIGWGFSNDFYNYADGHVGHHNILLNIGLFGYIFVNGIFAVLCLKIWRMTRKKTIKQSEGNAPAMFLLGLMAIFIIHSSSTQFWGYTIGLDKIVFFSFLFASVNAVFVYRISDY